MMRTTVPLMLARMISRWCDEANDDDDDDENDDRKDDDDDDDELLPF